MSDAESSPLMRFAERVRRMPGTLAVALIRFYQTCLSPLKPPVCRFQPTCSSYAIEAIRKYGLVRGGWRAFRRILRCHPWGKSGYDPP